MRPPGSHRPRNARGNSRQPAGDARYSLCRHRRRRQLRPPPADARSPDGALPGGERRGRLKDGGRAESNRARKDSGRTWTASDGAKWTLGREAAFKNTILHKYLCELHGVIVIHTWFKELDRFDFKFREVFFGNLRNFKTKRSPQQVLHRGPIAQLLVDYGISESHEQMASMAPPVKPSFDGTLIAPT
uniref:ULP_PROTEASE domain-containing protein n=1 Tax=Steinernema glaseri TaxID=37863 RepID=A0A1I7Z4B7_9BILA